ncbi:unnamed protein product [Caenorhabditis auriculariae]|uniref:Protein kinase domain-containing protein n=1 Tax=Caenorhabditis auriculariae TaxID=2777116 RepID=A0A8S1GST4_9PELO|nr:unnamed protein product [Caenorhabditis auriculariae]
MNALTRLTGLRITPKRLLIGATFGGSAIVTYNSIDNLQDLKQIGIIRFGRAAFAVGSIVVDYKSSLRGLVEPSEEYTKTMKYCHERSARKLLDLACVNGGVFIKVGQHLASLEYLIPLEYTDTLQVLTSRAPQASKEDVEFVIETELGSKSNEIFSDFSDKPVGAASLAQVHSARLKSTGQKVAVKVQHRRVLKNSRTDISTMQFLVKVADAIFPEFKLMWLVEEVKKNLPNELDFLHEAKNAEEAARRFKHLRYLKIPKIFYEYSTKRVLTMEFCEGAHIDDLEYMQKHSINTRDVCTKIGRMISEMIFLQGYLHSDPHPGNVLVLHKGKGKFEIVLLDHGLYLNISDHIRKLYTDLWLSIMKPDLEGMKRVANQMGVGELYGLFACIVTRRSWKSVTEGIVKSKLDASETDELRMYAASLIPQISEVLARMPREMLLILKTNDLMRNLEQKLGTAGTNDTHIEMSRCVVRSSYELAYQRANSRFVKIATFCAMYWALFKIRIYHIYLSMYFSLSAA